MRQLSTYVTEIKLDSVKYKYTKEIAKKNVFIFILLILENYIF